MRTYGRTYDEFGQPTGWVEVTTDTNGFNDQVYVTTLAQCLLLNIGESPFYANYGIPAQRSVIQQIFPDYYVGQTQAQFAKYFASLIVSKIQSPTPIYNLSVITHQGAKIMKQIPV